MMSYFSRAVNRHRHPINQLSPSPCQSINNQSIRVSHKRTKHSSPYVQSTHPPRHRPRVSKWHTQGGHEVRTLLSEQQHHQPPPPSRGPFEYNDLAADQYGESVPRHCAVDRVFRSRPHYSYVRALLAFDPGPLTKFFW